MAANVKKETMDMCVSVIFVLASVQLTLGIALPHQNVPSNALPGYRGSENIKNHEQISELISKSNSDIHGLFKFAEMGTSKIKDSLEHLRKGEIVSKIKQSWENLHLDGKENPLSVLENVFNQAPSFVTDNFVSSTYAGAPFGTRVVTVFAVDKDKGERGRVSYSMEPQSENFHLDPSSGVVTVLSPPATKDYTFNVTAQDHGNPPLSSLPARVTIIVRKLSAQFRPYGDDIMYPSYTGDNEAKLSRVRRATLPEESSSISEDADVGTVVYMIQETGSGLRYAMDSPANDKFSIDEMTGDVTLMESLDYETSSTEELNVQITNVSDAGMYTLIYT